MKKILSKASCRAFSLILCIVGISFAEDKQKFDVVEMSGKRYELKQIKTADDLDPNQYETVREYLKARDAVNKEEIVREIMRLLIQQKTIEPN